MTIYNLTCASSHIKQDRCDFRDRRSKKDRRTRPTFPLSRYMVMGKRGQRRRKADKRPIYVDRYSHGLLVLLCAILCLCVMDGYFTVINVFFMGASEMNPIMAYFLNKNITAFFLVKYGLTGIGLIFLCIRIHFKYVRTTLVAIFILYVFILCSHLYILFFFPLSAGG
jgi:hypothetical protein